MAADAYKLSGGAPDVALWVEQTWAPSIHITAYNKANIIDKFTDLNALAGGKPGGTFNYRKLANYASSTLGPTARGNLAGLNGVGAAETRVQGTPSTRYIQVGVIENVLAQLIVDPMQAFRNGAEMGLMEDIDGDGAGLFDDLTTSVVGSSASNIDSSLLLEAITKLAQNAKMYWQPGTGKTAYLCVAHNQIDDVLSDPNFVQADIRGDSQNALVGGWVNKAYGVSLTTSGNIVTSAGTAYNCLFIKEAFGIGWNQRMTVVNDRDGLERIMIPWADFTIMELNDEYAVSVQTTSA